MFACWIPRAAAALIAAGLWACASPPPSPIERGHPAHPQTAPAPETKLRVLSTYRDYTAQPEPGVKEEPTAQDSDQGKESGDAHEH